MKKFVKSVVAGLALSSCATQVKTVQDVVIDKEYVTQGAPKEELTKCKIVVKNIMTVLPSPVGPVPVEAVSGGQEKALICGLLDCSHIQPDAKDVFQCIPMSAIQPAAPQSDKSE